MIKIGHVAYVSMRLDETDSVIPFPRHKAHFLSYFAKKTCNFPMRELTEVRRRSQRSEEAHKVRGRL